MSRRFTVNRAFRIVSVLNSNEYCHVHFDQEQIRSFPDIEEQLRALDKVFTNSFGAIEYRNLCNMVVLACAMRLSAVKMKVKPITERLSPIVTDLPRHLHHDPDLTPLIASQFPHAERDEFHFGENYHDLMVGNTAVEVGDCRVSKVLEALKEGMDLWVIPEPFDTIYVFTKGRSWHSFERLEDYRFNALSVVLEKAEGAQNFGKGLQGGA